MRLRFFGNFHVLRLLQGLTVDDVGDDGLILARKVSIKELNHTLSTDFCFFIHTFKFESGRRRECFESHV